MKSTTSPLHTASPTASDVFAWFGTGQIVALDMRGGVVWSKHLGEEVLAV